MVTLTIELLKKYRSTYENIGLVTLIFLITFPNLSPNYRIGLDSSYMWAFNHLFINDYSTLRELVYPYGILGFLKMPLTEGSNFFYFLLFYTSLKIGFMIAFIQLSKGLHKIISSFILLITLYFLRVDFLLIGLSIMLLLFFFNSDKKRYVFMAACLSLIGLFIKSSIGISSFSTLIVAFFIYSYLNRNYRKAFLILGISLILITCLGWISFQNFDLFYNYIIHVVLLSLNYSGALSLHPENDWFALGLSILILFSLPFLFRRNRSLVIAFLLFSPVYFATWKHAMSREDPSHNLIFLHFLFLFWSIIIIVAKKKFIPLFLMAGSCIALFHNNMSNLPNFKGIKIDTNGFQLFNESVIHYTRFVAEHREITAQNISNNLLDKNILEIIGDSTVDTYPWELSYLPANHLNWKARKTLQAGSFSRWLDQLSAQDLNRENGAHFLLFHYVKDEWGGNFGSIDGRHLLNDTPLTVISLLNHYTLKLKNDKYLLFEKNKRNNFNEIKTETLQHGSWNKWITIPPTNHEILRVKLTSTASFLGKTKNFFYKTEPYYIDYLFDDSSIKTYRYVPENAKDGIWISPFICHPASNHIEKQVKKIRFRLTSPQFNINQIQYQFERITLDKDTYSFPNNFNRANLLFQKNQIVTKNPLINLMKNFEENNQQSISLSSKGNAFSGNYANQIAPEGYSAGFEIPLDTLWTKTDANHLFIETDLRAINWSSDASAVITLSDSNNDFWEAKALTKAKSKNEKKWSYHLSSKTLSRKQHSTGKLKIYVWNNGDDTVLLDDFRLIITDRSIEIPNSSTNIQ